MPHQDPTSQQKNRVTLHCDLVIEKAGIAMDTIDLADGHNRACVAAMLVTSERKRYARAEEKGKTYSMDKLARDYAAH
jgi:hypothetical protein